VHERRKEVTDEASGNVRGETKEEYKDRGIIRRP